MARAILHGLPVSSGIAVGRAFFLNKRPLAVRHYQINLEEVEAEAKRLIASLEAVAGDFAKARRNLPEELEEQAAVLDSHLLICRDPQLGDEALRRIREQRMNAEWAIEESVARIAETFNAIASPYIRERLQDVRAVASRVWRSLMEEDSAPGAGLEKGILLAHDLTPADAMGLAFEGITSFATELGGRTSHTGILARSLRIPAVVGVSGLEEELCGGETVIVDGLRGKILVEPSESEIAEYAALHAQYQEYQKRISMTAGFPAETEDGRRIAVLANIETAEEVEEVVASGAEGIGLVRSEFGFFARGAMPTEEDLYQEYFRIASVMAPGRVVIRTLDVGADKIFSEQKDLEEANPALGLRAIRYCLRHQDLFRRQLRAILRAGVLGNVSLMFPMISGLTEFRMAKSILNEAKQELDAAGIPFGDEMLVGIMIELPSAVLVAGDLAVEADFFSIGTNDLIQYCIGVDRNNKHVAHLHEPLHPAIIRAVKHVVDVAHKKGISVSVCGEMGSDPYCLPILLGMPVDEISVAFQAVAGVKHLVRRCDAEECRELLRRALSAPTARTINHLVRQTVYNRFPEDISFFISQLDLDA